MFRWRELSIVLFDTPLKGLGCFLKWSQLGKSLLLSTNKFIYEKETPFNNFKVTSFLIRCSGSELKIICIFVVDFDSEMYSLNP